LNEHAGQSDSIVANLQQAHETTIATITAKTYTNDEIAAAHNTLEQALAAFNAPEPEPTPDPEPNPNPEPNPQPQPDPHGNHNSSSHLAHTGADVGSLGLWAMFACAISGVLITIRLRARRITNSTFVLSRKKD
jgi:hypothetical protein